MDWVNDLVGRSPFCIDTWHRIDDGRRGLLLVLSG